MIDASLRVLFVALVPVLACAPTDHPSEPSDLGSRATADAFERIDEPGPIEFGRIVAADWVVSRAGLINIDHDRAREAGLTDEAEPIQIYMYSLRHPRHGLFLVDTGIDRATALADTDAMAASWLVRQAMNLDKLRVHKDTQTWLSEQADPLAGVFLTHLHLDHILGVPDLPQDVPIYVGPGEAQDSMFMNVFVQNTTDAALEGHGPLQELRPEPAPPFHGVLDLFGDGSLLGIHVPGHTLGSMAFLARTTDGPVLLTGDACHTAWGWNNDVESGTFNRDPEGAKQSFNILRTFAAQHPTLKVHLGHQSLASH